MDCKADPYIVGQLGQSCVTRGRDTAPLPTHPNKHTHTHTELLNHTLY